jgi:peptidoglycan-associated lipoprotein
LSTRINAPSPARPGATKSAPQSAAEHASTHATVPSEANAVFFAAGSATPSADGRRVIQSLAARLKESRLVTVTLIGHSDDTGSTEFDIAMAQRRVEAAANELERAGVFPRQIRRISYGNEARKTAPCTDEPCRQRERRVDLLIDG